MRWKVLTEHPFADAHIPAGTVVTEVWKNSLTPRERDERADVVARHRKHKEPPSIMVRWEGRIRHLSAIELMPEKVLVIDTETTGMGEKTGRVVEIGVALVEWDVVTLPYSRLVRCDPIYMTGRSWRMAQKVHKIEKSVLLKAKDYREVGRDLARWYKGIGKPPCAAYPSSFDSRMCAQTWPDVDLFWHPALCIQAQWRAVMGTKHPTLAKAAAALGVTPPEGQAHRALYDTLLAAEVIFALRR